MKLAKGNMLPPIDCGLCKERGKTDEIGKLFVIGQVSWFVLQCVGRKAAGLPVTLLVINTAVHVACAIGIYGLMWCKPQGASERIVIAVEKCRTCESFLMQNTNGLCASVPDVSEVGLQIESGSRPIGLTLSILGIIYGGLHAVAWDAHFPSYAEQILWRVSVVAIIVLACCAISLYVWWRREALLVWILVVSTIPRLYLVIEAFISVRSLPVGAYQTVDWPDFLPHVL